MEVSSDGVPLRGVGAAIVRTGPSDSLPAPSTTDAAQSCDSSSFSHERPRVLVVDDQRYVIEVLSRELARHLAVDLRGCLDATSALRIARGWAPTVILQDLVMPSADGFALLKQYRLDPQLREVPVIILSSREHPRDKSRAFALGANDYLVKIPDPRELAARVRSQSASFHLRRDLDVAFRQLVSLKTELELKNAELERVATRDGLTGLANRRCFDETLDKELRRASRDGSELSLILADVDYFKRFNDHYGHVEGDACLRRVALALRGHARRASDLAARYGGEEFAAILPATPREAACRLAERMRRSVAALAIPHAASDVAPHVTLSLGVATQRPGQALCAGELIGRADRALYHAKRKGRNGHGVYDERGVEAPGASRRSG